MLHKLFTKIRNLLATPIIAAPLPASVAILTAHAPWRAARSTATRLLREHNSGRPAGSKLWRKACEGKL